MRCVVDECHKTALDLVNICSRHFAPHGRVCAERRVNPFRPPVRGQAWEMTFNAQRWLWWRGRWRMQ